MCFIILSQTQCDLDFLLHRHNSPLALDHLTVVTNIPKVYNALGRQ